jgi:acyl-coenzyme A synthetase/AMP-(fatty) acid ligase/uncharacterized membrane protein/3-hydroxymyristoyl/3-hydroxydecanoyl-(acyl carrier protein) dehydratase
VASGFRKIFKALFFLSAALYPVFVYYFLVIKKIPLRQFSLFVILFALFAFITGTSREKGKKRGASFLRNSLLLLAVGILCFVTNSAVVLKFYPLLMNVMLLAAFGATCFFPPNMIFRFATMQDKTINGSLGKKSVEAYCRKVTIAWCGFFIFNGSVAAATIFSGSDALWSLYNGGISYILIGIFFAGELLIRKMVQKNTPKAVPLSALKNNSRPLSTVMCYDGIYSDAQYKTWGDFLEGTAKLRRHIVSVNSDKWLLYCDDSWLFLLALTALLQCKKEILLSGNVSPSYIAEIRGQGRSCTPFLTDLVFPQGECPENTFSLSALLESGAQKDAVAQEPPQIIADETSIVMYTSGSTGKPKVVKQRLTEFENDNRFVLSKWGDEFVRRKLCSTVNQHHIYGFLYSILLPFTAGVPFRRKKIEFPEELEKLRDTQYMIITVPAFLKRAVEIERPSSLCLKSPWIFTSGGVLNPETAKKTSEVIGFWPVEVYGSTETSGIAWRQSCNGLEWTPFDNAQLSKNEDGCLVIRSPYIKDPAGFQTADMVEMPGGGRFLLKGRIDSVVKIEEKRVSLVEIENRILQSGLASDVCVISLEDKRQYLAAALSFNDKGKERFSGLEKHEINKFWREYLLQYFENMVIPKRWRYLDALPTDAQGKKKRDDIKLLFSGDNVTRSSGFDNLENERVLEKTENSVTVEFSVPGSSHYFDGHFPDYPILPAVAQMEIAVRYASRYLETGIALSEIRRVKFPNIVRPFTPLLLKLSKKDKTITFNISSRDGKTIYSTGTVAVGIK